MFIIMKFLPFSMNVGKISKKGQVVIPKEIRDKFGIKEGDIIIFRIKGEQVIIEKIKDKMIKSVKDRITSVEDVLKKKITFQKLEMSLITGFCSAFPKITFSKSVLSKKEKILASNLRKEKYKTYKWNFKR